MYYTCCTQNISSRPHQKWLTTPLGARNPGWKPLVYGHGKYLLTAEFRFYAILCFILSSDNSDTGHIKTFTRAAGSPPLLYTNAKSNYLTNNTVRQWSANWGPRPNCGLFSSFYWAEQRLLFWPAWYVRAKVLHRLRGIKHRLPQQLLEHRFLDANEALLLSSL